MNQLPSTSTRQVASLALAALTLLVLTGCPGGLEVVDVEPAADATGVATTAQIKVTFSQPLDAATVDAGKFQVTGGGSTLSGTASASGATATFVPSSPLQAGTAYQVQVLAGIKGQNGAQLNAPYQWGFTTEQGPDFFVSSTDPANGASNVSPSVITVTFNEAVDPATVNGTTVTLDTDGVDVPGTVAASGSSLTFTPTDALEDQRLFQLRLVGVQSLAGDALAPYTLSFSTGSGATTGISGQVTYDWVPAASSSEGGNRLNYAGTEIRPARRITVEAVVNGGSPLITTTNDHGFFSFPSITDGASVQVRAYAQLKATGYTPDGRGPEACDGANWDIDVVDNTAGQALWALGDSSLRTAPDTAVNLHAATTHNGSAYTLRAGAPFAIADTFVHQLEKICQGDPGFTIPHLNANWSPNNVSGGSNPAAGQIGTSHYQHPASGPNLYILGDENSDTDEYDDHVVAHEFGHFLEDTLYRSDSVGGAHGMGDVLDPRVAFGEGYGNALSAISFDDPTYVDTNGPGQGGGFQLRMDQAPVGNDRGVYSEVSVMHLLWRLYENRDATANSGDFGRIHDVLRNHQRLTPALTTVQSFAAYYNQVYGAADGLETLWVDTLGGDYDSLCAGACAGTGDSADPFDVDNDLGAVYASTRTYSGSSRSADFWRLYKTVSGSGFTTPTDHDVTLGTAQGHNRFGAQRWYRFVSTGTTRTAQVDHGNCGTDVLDMEAYRGGLLSRDDALDGCPKLSLPGSSGATYILSVYGFGTDVNGFGVELQ